MNREIKFRVFDNRPEKDGYPSVMINHDYLIKSDYLRDGLLGKFPIMQYVGLKDKNGVEIYEGDIIKLVKSLKCGTRVTSGTGGRHRSTMSVICEHELVSEVVYFENKFTTKNISYSQIEEKYRHHKQEPNPFSLIVDVNSNMEVIGNIHENPELLEQESELR